MSWISRWAWLRECLTLQQVNEYHLVKTTTFGRARIDYGHMECPGVDRADRYAMLYWVRLPVFQIQPVDYGNREAWCQAVLYWHGVRGFRVMWDAMHDGWEKE